MKNLKVVLEEAGSFLANVVKTTAFITDMSTYAKVVQVYGNYMSEPYLVRETACVKKLPMGAKVEISMIACKK